MLIVLKKNVLKKGDVFFMQTKEIQRTITISKSALLDMIVAQNKNYKYWSGNLSKADYKAGIVNVGATALGFVFKSTVVGVIYSVITGAVSWASTSYKKLMVSGTNKGLVFLNDLLDIFQNHSNYKSIEVKMPYVQFTDPSTGKVSTVIHNKGQILKFNTNTGSVPA